MPTRLIAYLNTRRPSPGNQHPTPSASADSLKLTRYVGIIYVGVLLGVLLTLGGWYMEGGAVVVISFLPLYLMLDQKLMPGFLLGPCSVTGAFNVFGYGIGPLLQKYVIGWTQFDEQWLVPAQWGAVLSMVAFAAAYYGIFSAISRRPQEMHRVQVEPDIDWYRYGLLLLIFAATLIGFGFVSGFGRRLGGVQGGVGVQTMLAVFGDVRLVTFFFLGYAAAHGGDDWRRLWIAALITLGAVALLDGARGPVAYYAIASVIGLHWGGVPKKRILASGIIALLIYMPLSDAVSIYRSNSTYRVESADLLERSQGLLQAAMYLGEDVTGGQRLPYEEFVSSLTVKYVDRMFMMTPDMIPYAFVDGLGRLVYVVTPRIINPDRPNLGDANEILAEYGVVEEDAAGNYVTTVGEGYRRFGWPGIPVLSALVGLVFGAFTALAWRRRSQRVWMALLVLLTIWSREAYSQTASLLFYLVAWTIPKNLLFFAGVAFLQSKWFGRASGATQTAPALQTRRNIVEDARQNKQN